MKFKIISQIKSNSFLKRSITLSVLIVFTFLSIFTYSKTANAGLFSYINSVFGSEQASAKTSYTPVSSNSQTIALLQAATNRDPNPEKLSGSSPIIDNVLIADIVLSESIDSSRTNSTQISVYTVRSGDTISEIAEMFGVSVNTLMWANDIDKGAKIRVGQTLIILPVTGINYTVVKGDTIKGIAQKYKADLDEILQYNDISLDSGLVIGQTIIIPDAEIQVSIPVHSTTPKNNLAHDTNGPNYSGYYMRPITDGLRTQGLHGYNGVDLADSTGTPIYASASGTVIASATGGWNGGYGNFVIISHANGTQTLYAHNSKNLVSVGKKVSKGDKIALVGNTGKSTGPHLHFEIRGAKNPF